MPKTTLMIEDDKPKTVYWLDNNLYLNITNQCSNNCWFCFRNFKKGISGFNLRLPRDPTAVETIAELQKILPLKQWNEVVFCGFGEPTTKLDVLLLIANWLQENLSRVPIRLNTNGHGCALNKGRAVVKELKAAGISRVSVSLNGYDKETYDENCRPKISKAFYAVLDFVGEARTELETEVTVARMPEVDIQKVKAVANSLGVQLRVRDYVPCFW